MATIRLEQYHGGRPSLENLMPGTQVGEVTFNGTGVIEGLRHFWLAGEVSIGAVIKFLTDVTGQDNAVTFDLGLDDIKVEPNEFQDNAPQTRVRLKHALSYVSRRS